MNKKMNCINQPPIVTLLQGKPQAVAVINGSNEYPNIYGLVRFYQSKNGVVVFAEITGLPETVSVCSKRIFGFHIHTGTSCSGNSNDPFADTMAHYNSDNCGHPFHNGDLLPLLGSNDKALSIFLTNRFTIDDIIDKAIIIHDSPDDFTTQPSGNSGKKIACGIIRQIENGN